MGVFYTTKEQEVSSGSGVASLDFYLDKMNINVGGCHGIFKGVGFWGSDQKGENP